MLWLYFVLQQVTLPNGLSEAVKFGLSDHGDSGLSSKLVRGEDQASSCEP